MGELLDKGTHYGSEQSSDLIATLNERYAAQKEEEKGSVFARAFGGYWEALTHGSETALDTLTPIRPSSKLVHMRTAIESYERQQVFGTENAFWQHPIRDFIRPFATRVLSGLGFDSIPKHIQQRRGLEEYFDTLKYVKYSRLSNIARASHDADAVKEFEAKKDQTLFGINPYTRNYTSIFRSLPRKDRDYFNAFVGAETVEERQRILELVPENEKGLYVARWKLAFADEVRKAKKSGILSEKELMASEVYLDQIYGEAKTEGLPSSKDLFQEYLATRGAGESYPDWYRRTKLLPDKAGIPGPDWVGWHPSVDLEDIKLKVVQTMGEDMHDYNLWASRAQTLTNKPYINEAAIEPILQPDELTDGEMRDRMNKLLSGNRIRGDVFVRTSYGGQARTDIDMEEERDISDLLSRIV